MAKRLRSRVRGSYRGRDITRVVRRTTFKGETYRLDEPAYVAPRPSGSLSGKAAE